MGSQRPVGQLEEPPDCFDQYVQADEDVIQQVPQEARRSVRQVHCCVTSASQTGKAVNLITGALPLM